MAAGDKMQQKQKFDEVITDLIAKSQSAQPTVPEFAAGAPDVSPDTQAQGTPEFAQGGKTDIATEQEKAKGPKELLAEHQARIAQQDGGHGKEATQAQGGQAQAETPQPKPEAPAAQTQAAEAAAEQLLEEFEEFEFEDPDLSTEENPIKYKLKAPKQYLETAKRGYGRRAAYDRAIRYLGEAAPILKPLIENGQIRQFLPLIQEALSNQQYGDFVANGFQRVKQGLPLIEQAKQEAAQAGQPAYQQQMPQPQTDMWRSLGIDPQNEDPFFLERIAPLLNTTMTLQQRLDAIDAERNTVRQQWQEQQQQSQRIAQERIGAHNDLARTYPGRVNLGMQQNDPFYQQALRAAQEAGYTQLYGERAGIVLGAQLVMQIENERLAATASPTAQALQNAEALKLNDLARQQAADSSRLAGGGAVSHAPKPAPLQPPSSFYPNGQKKPASVFMQEQRAYLAQTGALA